MNNALSVFLAQLQERMSNADKEARIRDLCTSNPWFKALIKTTYDPFMQFYIKKGLPKPAAGCKTIVPFDGKLWQNEVLPLLLKLNARAMNKAEISTELGGLLGKLSPEDQEGLKRVILKDLRCGIAAKTINKALGEELIPVPDTQLCKAWDPSMEIPNVDEWWVTPKLNGLRGRWTCREGVFQFLTREDFPLVGFDVITEELKDIQQRYGLALLDGEVFSFDLPFQTIMSVARGEKNFDPRQKEKLQFHIFNVLKQGAEWGHTQEMVDELNSIFQECSDDYPHLKVLEYTRVPNNPEALVGACRDYTARGYEGIVMRHPEVAWEPGKRNIHLMKYKLFFETDLAVTDVLYGAEGKKWQNSVAALLCEGVVKARELHLGGKILYKPVAPDEVPIEGEVFKNLMVKVEASCSSCTDEERAILTEAGKELIGMTAEVKFQGFGDTPISGGNGAYSLQFPVFLKFKNLD